MQKFFHLIFDGFDHAWMRMSSRADGDSGIEIKEDVAVYIFDHRAFAALDDERVRARVGRRNIFGVLLNNGYGLRAGKFGFQRRQFGSY